PTEAARAVLALPSEQRPDDVVFFPILQHERTAGPFALGEDQVVREECSRLVGRALVIPKLTLAPELAVPIRFRKCLQRERARGLYSLTLGGHQFNRPIGPSIGSAAGAAGAAASSGR